MGCRHLGNERCDARMIQGLRGLYDKGIHGRHAAQKTVGPKLWYRVKASAAKYGLPSGDCIGPVVLIWRRDDLALNDFPFGIIFDLVFGDQKDSCSSNNQILGLREHPLIIIAAMPIHGEASTDMIGQYLHAISG